MRSQLCSGAGHVWFCLNTTANRAPFLAPDSGVTSLDKVLPALRAMAELGMPLLVHGEVTDDDVDMFDREAVFIRTKLVRFGRCRCFVCLSSVYVRLCLTAVYVSVQVCGVGGWFWDARMVSPNGWVRAYLPVVACTRVSVWVWVCW